MTETFYRSHSEAWFKGKRVQNLEELKSGMLRIPPGQTLTIRGKQRGFALERDACEHCQVSIFITKVPPHKVTLVDG